MRTRTFTTATGMIALLVPLAAIGLVNPAFANDSRDQPVAISWSEPVAISDAVQNPVQPQIAVSSDGTRATAAWRRSTGGKAIIQVSSAAINANNPTWSEPTNVSTTGDNVRRPQVSLSADGTRATVIWQEINSRTPMVKAASATIDGNTAIWSTPGDLSDPRTSAVDPRIGVSADGTRATAVWKRVDGRDSSIQSASATIDGNTATWSTPSGLSAPGGNSDNPQVSLSADGARATVVWQELGSGTTVIRAASATIDGKTATWSRPIDLTDAQTSSIDPRVGLSADGTRATAVWKRHSSGRYIVQSASATISGSQAAWSHPRNVSTTDRPAEEPQIGLSADGTRATAIWLRPGGSDSVVQSASAIISGNSAAWSTPTSLSTPGKRAASAQVGLSADGTRSTAVWLGHLGGWLVQSASAIISGNSAAWSKPTSLSTPGQGVAPPQVGSSADGTRMTAVWTRWSPKGETVESATSDLSPAPAARPGAVLPSGAGVPDRVRPLVAVPVLTGEQAGNGTRAISTTPDMCLARDSRVIVTGLKGDCRVRVIGSGSDSGSEFTISIDPDAPAVTGQAKLEPATSIGFEPDSTRITAAADRELRRIAARPSGREVVLVGHAHDYRPGKTFDQQVSRDRVNSARRVLEQHGFEKTGILNQAVGSTRNTPDPELNRRVDIYTL